MQFAILSTLLVVVALLAVILAKVRSKTSADHVIRDQFSSFANSLNSRLDSVQQGLLTNLNTSLQTSSQALTTSIAGIKEETRSRIDERVMAFTTDLRSAFDAFREQIEGRFGTLETQLTAGVSELQRSTTQELTQGRKEQAESLNAANNSLLERFDKLKTGNERSLAEIRQSIEAKLADNIEKNIGAFKEMTLGIAELKSTGQRIAQVGEEIGELTDILRSPKLRGDFGEFELENMIRDVIPPDHYQIKAQVNGVLADAAISLKEGLLCIDSKFPLDNYRRAVDPAFSEEERQSAEKAFEVDVKGHVETIASKYIVPGITLDFALMFVPAESVYYQICLNQELQTLCRQIKVLPVSPNTLYAYFQVLAIGFRGMKLQEAAKRIEEVLLRMKRDFDTFKNSFRLVGSHLQNAQNRFSDANIAAEQFSVTLDRLQFGSVEVPAVDAVVLPELTHEDSQCEEQEAKPRTNAAGSEPA